MIKTESTKKTTKELIIEAAFSFFDEDPKTKDFSLSELAAKVGITKPAIYRHFKNKDDIFVEMYRYFTDKFAYCLKTIQEASDSATGKILTKEPLSELIRFFAENTSYINYMISMIFSKKNFEIEIAKEMQNRGIKNLSDFRYKNDGTNEATIVNIKDYVRSVFCGITFFMFIKMRQQNIKENKKSTSSADFAKKLVDFVFHGIKNATIQGDILYPTEISSERKHELNEICFIDEDVLPKENKIFLAFAKVIKQYKFSGMTIERVADELNMAKSSLYEYFENKNEMISSLIFRELNLMGSIAAENAKKARNFSEYIFIQLKTELYFFLRRPEVIMIFGWLLTSSMNVPSENEFKNTNAWREKLPEILERPDFGTELKSKHFMNWIGALPVALVVQGYNHNVSSEDLEASLDVIFDYMEFGIQPNQFG